MIELKTTHNEAIERVVFSPDGELLAAVGTGSGLSMWSLTDRQSIRLRPAIGVISHATDDKNIGFSSDGSHLIGVAYGSLLRVIDRQTWSMRAIPAPGIITTTCVVADGSRVCMANARFIACLDVAFGEKVWQHSWGPDDSLRPIISHPASGQIVGIASPDRIDFRSALTGEIESQHHLIAPWNGLLAFSHSGKVVATGKGTRIHVYTMPSESVITELRTGNRRHFTGIAFHPNDRVFATTSNDQTVRIWDASNCKEITTFTWEIGAMRSIAFAPDGLRMAAGSSEGRVMVWDVDF